MPSTKENRLPSAKLRLPKDDRSTIGARAVNTRTKNAAADKAEMVAKSVMVESSSQTFFGPSSSTYSSAPRKPAMERRPHQTKCSNSAEFGLSKSTSRSTAMVTAMPGMTLTKNSQCQDIASVR